MACPSVCGPCPQLNTEIHHTHEKPRGPTSHPDSVGGLSHHDSECAIEVQWTRSRSCRGGVSFTRSQLEPTLQGHPQESPEDACRALQRGGRVPFRPVREQ